MATRSTLLLTTGFLAAIGPAILDSPAMADTMVSFFTGTTTYAGPFNGTSSVYYAITHPAVTPIAGCGAGSTTCTVSGGDILSNTIAFTGSGAGITATSPGSKVWWDMSPPYAGLGVGTNSGSAASLDDQINVGEILHLSFTNAVTLTGIATLFDDSHTPFGSGYSAATVATHDFLFCAATFPSTCSPTSQVTFGAANTLNMWSATGTDFYFSADGTSNVDFYLSGLTYRAVPAPALAAGLPGAILAIGGTLAWWRRRQRELATVA